uniref:Chromogranin B n=1 Tax=Mastacembelus armatus TaxID=205130 RepID=A0A7N9AT24_9TELE
MTLIEPKAFLPRFFSPLLSLFEALLCSSLQSSRRPVSAAPSCRYTQRRELVTRCLVEVLSKALSKPDSQLDQECKDILQAGLWHKGCFFRIWYFIYAQLIPLNNLHNVFCSVIGVKHTPLDKKRGEGVVTHEDVVKGHAEEPIAKAADVKDIEALLKSVEEKRNIPEDERSQESWSLGDEKRHENEEQEEREKRSWRPGRYHQRKHKRGEEEEDNERSQESWGVEVKRSEEEEGEERDKRNWRPGRYHQRKHKRGEEEEDNERSQESWGVEVKRSEEEEGEERDKRNWRPGRYHQRKHKRDEEPLGEEREEPEEERSQESWDVEKRHGIEDEEEKFKHVLKPTQHYHHKKKLHKRSDEPSE